MILGFWKYPRSFPFRGRFRSRRKYIPTDEQVCLHELLRPASRYLCPGQVSPSPQSTGGPHATRAQNAPIVWMAACPPARDLQVKLRRPSQPKASSSSTAAQVICVITWCCTHPKLSKNIPLGEEGGGGDELSCGISRTVPSGPSFSVYPGRKNMQQCRSCATFPPPSALPS